MNRLFSFVFAMGLGVCTVATAQPSAKINVTPGKWSDELDFTGPAGETMQVRKGRSYVNGKDMLAGQLTAAQLRELEASSVNCVAKEDIPTVQQYVNDLMSDGQGGSAGTMSNLRIVEATASKVRFDGDFATDFFSEKPYAGAINCTASFAGDRTAMQCDITWKTPPHKDKKSKMLFKSARIGAC